ncbi:uncharacterized protein BDR25DRAFT_394920 [Lindgomyces ingoldianus]|uniref:Uncharacterized protein n=1 Tax=Lindgomyces ingoldianus TaxID=673940 RepID=A0ACB6QPC9_9PLEO|nr:uncharacterized protein BDR25DRAFT_394920 [Lindgomyces ingoldianus]KAF2468147.1 hypothetical protein BDR25DRAFT_394920 [Lindgomyces ingoldianus]
MSVKFVCSPQRFPFWHQQICEWSDGTQGIVSNFIIHVGTSLVQTKSVKSTLLRTTLALPRKDSPIKLSRQRGENEEAACVLSIHMPVKEEIRFVKPPSILRTREKEIYLLRKLIMTPTTHFSYFITTESCVFRLCKDFTTSSHPASSSQLQRAFKQSLPHSISLMYRTQHENRTSDAHILATFPPDADIPHCWAAAYYDRSMRPETELWVFASGEIPGHSSRDITQFCPTCRTALLSMIEYMGKLPVPPLHPDNETAVEQAKLHEKQYPELGKDVRYPVSPGSYLRHLLLPSIVTLGAVHHQVMQLFLEAGLVREDFPGPEAALNKFLFKFSALPQTKELPAGLRWGEVRRQDIAIVQSRTAIPRATRTLMSLKNVGVFDEETDKAVAWAFLGLDGSLTALHVEPGYRGKGIAKAVATRMFKRHAPGLAEDGEGMAWAHADVYVGNTQSEAVCRSLGGEDSWKIFWVRIDVATLDLDEPVNKSSIERRGFGHLYRMINTW